MAHDTNVPSARGFKGLIEWFILSSKWILIPFYAGLYIVLIVYAFLYSKELFHLVHESAALTKNQMLMIALEMVDIVMIANLVKMIITGSYNSFVSKFSTGSENVSSGMLKVKMSTSLIGVSSIHLLQSFISADVTDWDTLKKKLFIHGMFLIGALALAVIDYLHELTIAH